MEREPSFLPKPRVTFDREGGRIVSAFILLRDGDEIPPDRDPPITHPILRVQVEERVELHLLAAPHRFDPGTQLDRQLNRLIHVPVDDALIVGVVLRVHRS